MIQAIKHLLLRIVRLSETYVKTDMMYLTKGGFWLTAGQGVAAVSAFVLSIFFANYLSPDVYGTYKYALSLAGIFGILTLGGMSTALQRAIAKGDDGAAYSALKARLYGGLLACIAAFALAVWYTIQGNTELAVAMVIVAFGAPLMEAYGLYEAILQGKGRFSTSTISFAVSSITATLALIAAIIFSDGSLYLVLLAYFGTWTVTRLALWRYAQRFLTAPHATDTDGTVVYGFRLSLIGIVSAVAGQIDKILIFKYLGPVQLATYAFATAMPEQLKAFVRNIGPLALSRFSRRSSEEILSSIHYKAVVSALATIPLIVLYILAAPFLFQTLFPAYTESILPSQVYALSMIMTPIFVYSAALQSQRAEKLIAVSDISLNIVQIILLAVLIPLYGLWGAITARIVGRLLGVAVLGISVRSL